VVIGLVMLWLVLLVMEISLGGLIHVLLLAALGVMAYGPLTTGSGEGS
jgi:hypothetical protein